MSTLEMVLWAALIIFLGALAIACCCCMLRPPRCAESDFLLNQADEEARRG
jgi:hypothetical protein